MYSNGLRLVSPSLSIALRMSIWYAVSAFGLVAVTMGLLYWVLVSSLYQEDVRDLSDNLNNAHLLWSFSNFNGTASVSAERLSGAPRVRPEIYIRVLDGRGQILVETPGMAGQLPAPSRAELESVGNAHAERRDLFSAAGLPFLSLTVRISSEGASAPIFFLQAAMNREHDEYLLARYRERLWMALVVALIASSLVGYTIVRRGMRPIRRIASAAERIESSTLNERIDSKGLPSELSGLVQTFNGMLGRLEEGFRRVSQFSDDVAHELRTPINNLRGEIEVALNKARSAEHYRGTLESCSEECQRISRIIESLLFLARTEASSKSLCGEQINVGEELRTVQEFYEAAAMEVGVQLSVSAPEEVFATVERTLFQQAIGNLVSNGIAHTMPGGKVEIRTSPQGGNLIVTVSDTGRGIAAEHLPYVFDRFYRADPARSGSAQHVGLGLAVVKGIVARHGGYVDLVSEIGTGTKVTLAFPL